MSYRDALDQCLAARGLAIHPYLELGSAALLCQMVEQGMGLSFLPEYIVRPALAAGRLARLNVPDCTCLLYTSTAFAAPTAPVVAIVPTAVAPAVVPATVAIFAATPPMIGAASTAVAAAPIPAPTAPIAPVTAVPTAVDSAIPFHSLPFS